MERRIKNKMALHILLDEVRALDQTRFCTIPPLLTRMVGRTLVGRNTRRSGIPDTKMLHSSRAMKRWLFFAVMIARVIVDEQSWII
jgi:hypothetical protein